MSTTNISMENIDIALAYFLGDTTEFDKQSDLYKNMFLAFSSDNNSSTLREAMTLRFLKYTSNDAKHGADGVNPVTGREVEVKPKFVVSGKKLTTSGNFNDLSYDLLEQKKDQDIVCSMFYQDRLVYVVEFPISVIYDRIKDQLTAQIKSKRNRKVCSFGYKDYDSNELVVHYLNKELIAKEACLSKPHQKMLESKYTK